MQPAVHQVSAEKECDSMNISLTNASGAKTAIDQAVNALAEAKAMQVDTTTAQKALADLVTQFTALSDSLSDMPDMPKSAANFSQLSASLPRERLHSTPEQAS